MAIGASRWSFTLFLQTICYLMALGEGLICDVILEEGSDFCEAISQGVGVGVNFTRRSCGIY